MASRSAGTIAGMRIFRINMSFMRIGRAISMRWLGRKILKLLTLFEEMDGWFCSKLLACNSTEVLDKSFRSVGTMKT